MGRKRGKGGTYLANKDLSTFELFVGHFGDGFLGFFGRAVLDNSTMEKMYASVSDK